MAEAVADDAGPGTAIYDLRIARTGDGHAKVMSFSQVQAAHPVSGKDFGESVIELDWADASGVLLSRFSTRDIASLVVPYLTNPFPDIGIDQPLADGPIHLIGHSRGGSLVASLADQLGNEGIWVNQLTTLDPHPVSSAEDASMAVSTNVIFSDNYYETTDAKLNLTDGYASRPLTGSHNVNLDPIGLDHSAIHVWYHGTTDTAAATDGDSSMPILAGWYAAELGPRDQVGYAYSRVELGTPPGDGVSSPFGGTASRVAVSDPSGNSWPNIADLQLTSSETTLQAGRTISVQYKYESDDAVPTVQLYLDTNENPYDAGGYAIGSARLGSEGEGVYSPSQDISGATAGVAPGNYYLMAAISDGTHTRYTYYDVALTITPAPIVYEPDLTGSIYYAPPSVSPGAKNIPLGVSFANHGNVPISGTYFVAIYASLNNSFDSSDLLVGTVKQKLKLSAGGSSIASLKFASPSNVPDGTYHLIAYLDSAGLLTESSVDNNAVVAAGTTIITAPFVDVVTSFSSVPGGFIRAKKATSIISLTNNGNVLTTGSAYERIFASSTIDGSDRTQIGSLLKNVKIKPGQTVYLKVNLSYFGALSSIYLLGSATYLGNPGTLQNRSGEDSGFQVNRGIPVF